MIASRENNKLQGWTAPDRSENGTRIFVAADISDWIRFKLQLKRWFFYFLRFQQNVIVNVPDTFSNIAGQFFFFCSNRRLEGVRCQWQYNNPNIYKCKKENERRLREPFFSFGKMQLLASLHFCRDSLPPKVKSLCLRNKRNHRCLKTQNREWGPRNF